VKREDFIPDVIWVDREDGWMVPLSRSENPEMWLKIVNGDDSIVTQVDDGRLHDGKGIFPTSSSTACWLMAPMLDLLDVKEGMDVLEIGTGTGYNAALLAERTRTGLVTTVEVDPEIAEHARRALSKTGHRVAVITGDGTLGHVEHAPYDRVVATAAAVSVPYPWVEQARPGGRILLPLAGSFQTGALLCLTVHGDGTAQGRFHGKASFMRLRGHRPDKAVWWENEEDAQITTSRLYPREVFTDFNAGFAVGVKLPGCRPGQKDEGGAEKTLLLSHAASGSWASLTPGTADHEVCQFGPRRLWDELEAARDWWIHAGRPDHTRFGITVTPEGQVFWLDTPDQLV
jgi:protein-L-isoaspartate O-methyltransferase